MRSGLALSQLVFLCHFATRQDNRLIVRAPNTPFVMTREQRTTPATPLQANYNGQDFQDDLKRLSKVTGRAAVNVGKAALKGLGAGIRGAKAISQDESVKNGVDIISKGVQQGVKGIKNLVGETRDNEQVQKGIERLKNIVDESQKRVKETLLNANQKQTTTFNEDTYFDREDEDLISRNSNEATRSHSRCRDCGRHSTLLEEQLIVL